MAPRAAGPKPRSAPEAAAAPARRTHCGSARRPPPAPSLPPANFLRSARPSRRRGRCPEPREPAAAAGASAGGSFEPTLPSSLAAPVRSEGGGTGVPPSATRAARSPRLRARPSPARRAGQGRAGRGAERSSPAAMPVCRLSARPGRRDGRCGAVTLPAPVPRRSPSAPSPGKHHSPRPGQPQPCRAGLRGNAALPRPPRSRERRAWQRRNAGRRGPLSARPRSPGLGGPRGCGLGVSPWPSCSTAPAAPPALPCGAPRYSAAALGPPTSVARLAAVSKQNYTGETGNKCCF